MEEVAGGGLVNDGAILMFGVTLEINYFSN
jgi:hypothetical protein